MDFAFSDEQKSYRQEVRTFFLSQMVHTILSHLAESEDEVDPRRLYRLMGERRLLAPNWPVELGGRALSQLEAAIVLEEMSDHMVPDTLFVISVQIVGALILHGASKALQRRLLPPLASGEQFACVLYTEPDAGSDLAGLKTTAVADGHGHFTLHGRKVYSMKTHLADYAICAARTDEGSRYDAITLFVVPLRDERVHLRRLESISDESFWEVVLDGVQVGQDDVVGEVGGGWTVITKALALERTGHDYYVKARRWFNALRAHVLARRAAESGEVAAELARLAAQLQTSQLLCYRVICQIDSGVVDESAAAMAKWYASELASEVAWWALDTLGLEACLKDAGDLLASLESAYRDAPGTRISAGTSEMMLETLVRMKLAPTKGGASQ